MTDARVEFLAAARAAEGLLRRPEVAQAWERPSALAQWSVGGLAGHLAYQVLCVPEVLAAPAPGEETVGLLEHYRRSQWLGAGVDAEINVRIRQSSEALGASGPVALSRRVADTIAGLPAVLAGEDGARAVRLPFWGAWSLALDDLLTTRTMELAVHADDLAVSVGVPTPELPPETSESVIGLLTRLAVRRHGPVSVLRALSRAERAPGSIAAF
ncbi:maleylpyruvate isomerase N-terminal domain-containing protein [Kitasatospora cathayae]|uniref:Maleylpyruvate isomerase N-terminal domain-containing protein n=1 Tax=Kitasatospora cathayae TaxID=3004092 RepID=A0ABY7PYS2_9ACTN|nr:maleylpyruvate isomerase N-terminal domain-containing protein [Kitasatospora sp. HUAS 3-15]WBP85357.1 maleylpyruvate isomerase N-terminal domain-containing protein [Kitasatospora sp. HUAS 3-15]